MRGQIADLNWSAKIPAAEMASPCLIRDEQTTDYTKNIPLFQKSQRAYIAKHMPYEVDVITLHINYQFSSLAVDTSQLFKLIKEGSDV